MKNFKHLLSLFLLFAGQFSNAQSKQIIQQYIEKYKLAAIEEMIRTGVPAAITLAQGIHETSAGTSDLVVKSNNHFGIKCKSDWTGATVYHDDDARGECFRKYDDPSQSYKDHSDFLRNRPNYSSLFKLNPTDYKGWAYGLKKAGYATNPKYPQILIKLIEDYNLEDYTQIALGIKKPDENEAAFASANQLQTKDAEMQPAGMVIQPVAVQVSYPSGVFKINETKVIYVPQGTAFLKVADDHSLSLARLFDFNDMKAADISEGQLIFLERKRKQGADAFHIVAEGETIYSISQAEGLRMADLCEYNMIKPAMMIAAGEKLYLQQKAPAAPKLKVQTSSYLESASSSEVVTGQNYPEEPADLIVHQVQSKETAYAIARRYSVTIDDLKRWNELSSTDLKMGQALRIFKKATNAGY